MGLALTEKRLRWLDRQPEVVATESHEPLLRAYRLLVRKLGVAEEEAPIVARDARSLTFASRNFCPTLEACRILQVDTRRVCQALTEGATQAFLQRLDPRLTFTREYATLRPFGEACLETIAIREDGVS
jgi:hypothetical protein